MGKQHVFDPLLNTLQETLLQFRISSALELFHRHIKQILERLDGMLYQMDNILVLDYGTSKIEPHFHLNSVLKRLEAVGVTLNSEKC
jgi:hypothetical protein